MTERIVVIGAGYGGCTAVQSLEDQLDEMDSELVWVSAEDYHLILHEVHRCIRNPDARKSVTIPVEEIKSSGKEFVQATMTGLDVDSQTVELDGHDNIEYDYAVLCLGSQTAFYGIDDLQEHSLTVKSLGDALAINEHLTEAAQQASRSDPAQVVVGGGGLTGTQAAGEIGEWCAEKDVNADVHLVERSSDIFSGSRPRVSGGNSEQTRRTRYRNRHWNSDVINRR